MTIILISVFTSLGSRRFVDTPTHSVADVVLAQQTRRTFKR